MSKAKRLIEWAQQEVLQYGASCETVDELIEGLSDLQGSELPLPEQQALALAWGWRYGN